MIAWAGGVVRDRRAPHGTHRDRGFEAFVAGAAGRLLHTATLLTAEDPQHNPRACHLLTLALADTYAGWDRPASTWPAGSPARPGTGTAG